MLWTGRADYNMVRGTMSTLSKLIHRLMITSSNNKREEGNSYVSEGFLDRKTCIKRGPASLGFHEGGQQANHNSR